MKLRRLQVAAIVLVLLVARGLGTADAQPLTETVSGPGYVWWEGEDAVAHDFGAPSSFLTTGQEGICSGDAWLTAEADEAPEEGLTATWRVRVPEGGRYELWARLGYRPWRGNQWRVDGGPWQQEPPFQCFSQVVDLARHRPTSWTLFGVVELQAGVHELEARFSGQERVLQGFDCFVLSRTPFVPLGKFRPDEPIPVRRLVGDGERAGWWPFQPAAHVAEQPALDLSSMNDPVGSHGFVEMRDGELQFEDGTPVKFWGVNVSYHGGRTIYMSHEDADRFAEMLARLGVNIVRLHVMHSANSLIDDSYGDTQHFDEEKLDRLDYLAAALARRGIYVNLDLIYHRMFKDGDEIDEELVGTGERDGYNVNWAAGSAALFHPRAIELNRALYRKFLLHENPYTGRGWVDEPGMAMLTIQNEQSIFWGTTNIHRGRPRQILNRLCTDWLREKYGTHQQLRQAWQVEGEQSPFGKGENLETGTIELGRVGTQNAPHLRKRGIDQLRFLYHLETKFYRETIDAMRQWGVRCPIITSNWRGAGNTTKLVLQASALGGIVDRHHYSGGRTLLAEVGGGTLSGAFEQVKGRAFSISEWNAGVSGETVAEVVPLVATVAAFQGWDAMFQFCSTASGWETQLRGLNVTPGHYALYPVAAMIFRRGDVHPGDVVYERRRDPAFQFSFQPAKRPPGELIAVGRVLHSYVERPAEDLYRGEMVERLWDRDAGVVRANTGEFDWHYADRWMRLDAERTQGAFGNLKGRRIECSDLHLETPAPFAAVIATALDSEPIPEAERVLVAAVGRSQNLPAPEPARGAIEGRAQTMPPCVMEPVTGTVSVRTTASTVHALDARGFRLAQVRGTRDGQWLTFRMDGAPQVVYYELVR